MVVEMFEAAVGVALAVLDRPDTVGAAAVERGEDAGTVVVVDAAGPEIGFGGDVGELVAGD